MPFRRSYRRRGRAGVRRGRSSFPRRGRRSFGRRRTGALRIGYRM